MALLIANKFKSKEGLDSLQVTSTPFCPEQATDGIPSSIIDSWWKNRGKETTREKKKSQKNTKNLGKNPVIERKADTAYWLSDRPENSHRSGGLSLSLQADNLLLEDRFMTLSMSSQYPAQAFTLKKKTKGRSSW